MPNGNVLSKNFMILKYRPDIDGLRAIAVLSVIGFHFFPSIFSGGFIGVDIFFVISGFLITRILLTEYSDQGISFFRFYSRRILRIFPSLIIVLATCIYFGWNVLLANEYKQLGKHILAGAGFVSNFMLWFEAGYFDNVSETKPLLHLWSLGIEEQFYIVWPLLLWGLLKARRLTLKLVGAVFLASFVYSSLAAFSDKTEAFYSPASRAWELLAGALLSLAPASYASTLGRLKTWIPSALGLTLIAIGVFGIRQTWPFPGALALVPVGAAVLLIGAKPSNGVSSRILSNRAMVGIGRISYPLYLWHWPLMSFASIIEGGRPNVGLRLGLIAASFMLATATYLLVEKPFHRIPRRLALAVLVLLMVLLGLLGKNIFDQDGLERVRYRTIITISGDANKDFVDWENSGLITEKTCKFPFLFPEWNYCLTKHPQQPPTAAIIGDSHAFGAYWGLSQALERKGENLIAIGRGACVPFVDYPTEAGCQPHINNMIDYAADDPSIKTVILAFRGRYLPNQADPKAVTLFHGSLDKTLSQLVRAGKKVYYYLPVAEPGFDPRLCLGNLPLGRKPPLSCDILRSESDEKSKVLTQAVRTVLKKYPTVQLVDPNDYLCNGNKCPVIRDGHSMFKDDNHLSYSGSIFLSDQLFDLLPATNKGEHF
jgi:peptidoglycan/LPS O-acetylase OafA/YrhL